MLVMLLQHNYCGTHFITVVSRASAHSQVSAHVSNFNCSFHTNIWNLYPRKSPMRAEIVSYVQVPMGAYSGHYGNSKPNTKQIPAENKICTRMYYMYVPYSGDFCGKKHSQILQF